MIDTKLNKIRLNLRQSNYITMELQEIIERKDELIELKKAAIKFADPFTTPIESEVNKAFTTSYVDDIEKGIITRKIVANTYNWLDSHMDVHVGNTFKKSIGERSNKIFHLHDHQYKVVAKVGKPKKFEEVEISWKDLGVNINGTTKVLMLESEILRDYNKAIFDEYLKGEIDQHSVGMQYIKIELAVNDPEMKSEYETWKKYINLIGNKEKAEQMGYFWAVAEAKLIEVSAVLMGSNPITPTISNEPQKSTHKEPQGEPHAPSARKRIIV